MGWLVYILRCSDGSLYTGVTNDLERRLEAHRTGRGSRYVRSRLPFELAYRKPCKNRSDAQQRELAIKKLPRAGKEKLCASSLRPAKGRKGAAKKERE